MESHSDIHFNCDRCDADCGSVHRTVVDPSRLPQVGRGSAPKYRFLDQVGRFDAAAPTPPTTTVTPGCVKCFV